MLFNSIEFLLFFPIVVVIYFAIPQKLKQLWLLLASYYFYMCWNAKYAILILLSTAITYASGLLMEGIKQKKYDAQKEKKLKNWVVVLSFASNLSILFYFKYINFALSTLGGMLHFAHIELNVPTFDIMNSTPFVRQYDILSNKWGVLLCQKEYQTNDIRRSSRKWL